MMWPEIVRFDESARGAPVPFPVDALPEKVRRYVVGLAGEFLAPVDMPATMAIGALSAALAGRVRVQVQAGWSEPANLYLLSIAEPSTHKSPLLERAFKAFEEEEQDLVEQWKRVEHVREQERQVLRVELGHAKRRKMDDDANKARLRDLLKQLADLEEKPRPYLLVDDVTSERLGVLLSENGPIALVSAESRSLEMMAGLYRKSGETDIDLYLKAYSGDPVRIARLSRPDVFIRRPCLTLMLCIQPAAVAKLAGQDEFRGRGLIARILTSFPQSNVGQRDWSKSRPASDVDALHFNQLVRRLLSLPVGTERAPAPEVRLSPAAAKEHAKYRADIERSMRGEGSLEQSKDLGGKLPGHCARIALALHMVEQGVETPISGETMCRGIVLARYFAVHTVTTWSSLSGDSKAATVATWLEKERREKVTTREILRGSQRSLKTTANARMAAIELAERGYLGATDEANTWAVSPLLSPLSPPSEGPNAKTSGDERNVRRERKDDDSDDTSPFSTGFPVDPRAKPVTAERGQCDDSGDSCAVAGAAE
jgi:replicative DNA helicase